MTSKSMQLSRIDSRGRLAKTGIGKHERRGNVMHSPLWVTFVYRFVRNSNATEALALAPGQDVRTLTALALARAGDVTRAQTMAEHLDIEFPLNTLLHSYWLPAIRLALDLERGKTLNLGAPSEAAVVDLGAPPPLHAGTLYPLYLRGQAYLAAGQGGAAVDQFQNILAHPGIVRNFPLGALAHLGLARAYALSEDVVKSRAAYQDFLALWLDADPNVPILKEAKAEYAKLQ